MSHPTPLVVARRHRTATVAVAACLATLVAIPAAHGYSEIGSPAPMTVTQTDATAGPDHLLLSEVMTGGDSASDEFVELYNPTTAALALDGLELIYVTASGTTVTRKASWSTGAADIPAGAHLLVANEAGAFAPIADATYAGGLSATGGSVALRVAGAVIATDAVGWGSAASGWLEGTPAIAPASGRSLERLPGGDAGSGQDTDDNAADFVERELPEPQNAASAPTPEPGPTPAVTPTPEPTPTPEATPIPTPEPAISIADARAAADGSLVTIEGVALTAADFSDGGGFLADETGGIAVLLSDGSFARGEIVRVSGAIDDRYRQRTLRAAGDDLLVLGSGTEPAAEVATTGAIGEVFEGRLVELSGTIQGGATALSGAVAFDLDDDSGAIRIYVGDATGIDTGAWGSGVALRVRGIVGQRDATGTGTSGYRVMLRDPGDVLDAGAATPSPSPSVAPTPTPTPGASAPADELPLLTVAEVRAAGKNAVVRVRGVVTLPTGLIDPGSATIQDASGAIFLRPSEEAGPLTAGALVELIGMRSTWTGMESVRVSAPPAQLSSGQLPEPVRRATGAVGEADEALRISVRGEVVSNPQRTSAQNVYFDIDDGSGPLRVYLSPRAGVNGAAVLRGALFEVTGVLLQETSGQQPLRGYRLWPTRAADLVPAGSIGPVVKDDELTNSSGGVPGDGASTAPGWTAAPVAPIRAEVEPRLAAALPTASAAVVVTTGPTGAPDQDGAPFPPVLPVTVAAMALAGASGLLARGGLAARLAAQVRDRLVPLDDSDSGGGQALSEVPALIPLGVAPDVPVRPEARTAEHGGILPRT